MLAHYNALAGQLATDIADVLDIPTSQVYFGAQRNEIAVYPHGLVELQELSREFAGARQVHITWEIAITLRFARDAATGFDSAEQFKVAQADALTQKLAPFDESSVPMPSGPYAGVGMLPQVHQVIPGRETIEDNFLEVILLFRCVSGVYQ